MAEFALEINNLKKVYDNNVVALKGIDLKVQKGDLLGFVFGLMGMVAFVRLEKLTKELKAKGVLDENYKEE